MVPSPSAFARRAEDDERTLGYFAAISSSRSRVASLRRDSKAGFIENLSSCCISIIPAYSELPPKGILSPRISVYLTPDDGARQQESDRNPRDPQHTICVHLSR